MNDNTSVQINVDTFSDGAGYFVRTEIEARCVSIHGPFADAQAAQKFKADQLSGRSKVAEAIASGLREVVSHLPTAAQPTA